MSDWTAQNLRFRISGLSLRPPVRTEVLFAPRRLPPHIQPAPSFAVNARTLVPNADMWMGIASSRLMSLISGVRNRILCEPPSSAHY